MTALGDFSSGDVLTAADMNAIGTWTAFTPVWDNLTVGNGTQAFYYCQINDVLHIQGILTWGSTTAITGSFIRFASPVSSINTQWVGIAQLREDGVATRTGMTAASGDKVLIQYVNVSGALVNVANVSASNPFTWGTNDYIRISLTARLA